MGIYQFNAVRMLICRAGFNHSVAWQPELHSNQGRRMHLVLWKHATQLHPGLYYVPERVVHEHLHLLQIVQGGIIPWHHPTRPVHHDGAWRGVQCEGYSELMCHARGNSCLMQHERGTVPYCTGGTLCCMSYPHN